MNRNTWTWLLLGIAVTALAGNRFNVGLLGWVVAVPWLVYLRRTEGWRSHLLFFGALQIGTFLQIVKIVTEPLPWFFALMFSIPMAIGAFLAFALFEALRRRLSDRWGLVLFPAIAVLSDWSSATFSEMGSWGGLAYTQLDNLPLLQVTSLFGLSGVAMLLAATSALFAVLIDTDPREWKREAAALAALVLAAHIYGAFRMYRPLPGPLVTVAAVVSDVALSGGELPPADELAEANDQLFERSRVAAERGAEIIVWNEGSTAINTDDEQAFLARGQALATEHGVDLVLAYVVPLDGMSRFENKYVWLGPEGPVETYFKHHPVPGEGSVRGTEAIAVHARPWGRAAGAICYDYDFPQMGAAHAAQDAGLVVVPSSDWRGIDPYHTQMASVRGIEGGFSVLRPVRWATSTAYDALGRARGSMSWFEGERLMLSRVPATRIPTLYARIGDVLPAGAGLLLLLGLLTLVRRVYR